MGPQRRSRTVIPLVLWLSLSSTALANPDLEQQAYQAYLNKSYPEAISLYQKLIREKPLIASHHFSLGVVYQHAGQWDSAIQSYQKTLELEPDHVDAQHNLGAVYVQLKRWPEAFARYQEVIRLQPQDPEAHFNLALAQDLAGQSQAALVNYRKVLQLKPNHPQARQRVQVLSPRQASTPAQSTPSSVEAELNQARRWVQAQKWGEAQQLLAQIILKAPRLSEAHFLQGRTLEAQGQYPKALKAYIQALSFHPGHPTAQHRMALVYEKMGRRSKAQEVLSNLLQVHPEYIPALYDQARLYDERQAVPSAIALFEKVVSLKRDYADSLYRLGRLYHKAQKPKQARAYYEQSIQLRPELGPAYSQLAKLAMEESRWKDAQRLLQTAQQRDAQNPEVHFLLATLSYQQNPDAEEVLHELNQALKLNPQYTNALAMRGIYHYDKKAYPEAIADFQAALKQQTNRPDIYRNLGIAQVKAGQARGAIASFENYLKTKPQAADRQKIKKLIQELRQLVATNP